MGGAWIFGKRVFRAAVAISAVSSTERVVWVMKASLAGRGLAVAIALHGFHQQDLARGKLAHGADGFRWPSWPM